MQHRTGRLAAAFLAVVLLAGCASTGTGAKPSDTPLTEVPTSPASAKPQIQPISSGIVDTVFVSVYTGTQFTATHGCGCTVKTDSQQELFPASTPVVLLKITLTGVWKPSQGNATTQNVTGLTMTGTKFDGRPEDAVLDSKDGPEAARKLGLPWLAEGLFGHSSHWSIPNDTPRSFAAAWYVPAGVDRLILTIDVPTEDQPNRLYVNLPAVVLKLSSPDRQ